jgi:hypothetical protein
MVEGRELALEVTEHNYEPLIKRQHNREGGGLLCRDELLSNV